MVSLLWETSSRESGDGFQGVAEIELLENLVRQRDAIQFPERVVVAVVVEIFVARLQYPPIVRILVWLVGVLPEQQPVLVLDEKVVRKAWLPADVVKHRADLAVDVRHLVEHPPETSEVIRVPSQMSCDKRRLGMLLEQPIALGHQRLESRKARILITAILEQRTLHPAPIREIDRIPELLWVRGVDEDRDVEAIRRIPDRIELWIVDSQA